MEFSREHAIDAAKNFAVSTGAAVLLYESFGTMYDLYKMTHQPNDLDPYVCYQHQYSLTSLVVTTTQLGCMAAAAAVVPTMYNQFRAFVDNATNSVPESSAASKINAHAKEKLPPAPEARELVEQALAQVKQKAQEGIAGMREQQPVQENTEGAQLKPKVS